ncbi:MAG: endonuclease III [Acidobacteriota bacterium]
MKSAAEVQAVLAVLGRQHPDADTELRYTNAFELLVATILSAQSTDARVNQVTPSLFARYPDARSLAQAASPDVEAVVQSTGFFRQKTRALIGMATALVERHGGDVPRTMESLIRLPGVGRKTANVVLGHALGVPGLAVDRHVLRVANRLGIAASEDPERVEQQLTGALAPAWWTRASDTLILHGRRVCRPRPLCEYCHAKEVCDHRRSTLQPRVARTTSGRTTKRTRRTQSGRRRAPRR